MLFMGISPSVHVAESGVSLNPTLRLNPSMAFYLELTMTLVKPRLIFSKTNFGIVLMKKTTFFLNVFT